MNEPAIHFSLGKHGQTFYDFACGCCNPDKHWWTQRKEVVTCLNCLTKISNKGEPNE